MCEEFAAIASMILNIIWDYNEYLFTVHIEFLLDITLFLLCLERV